MTPTDHPTGFAPADITDGRREGDWKSRYPPKAWAIIIGEGIYLLVLLFGAPILLLWICSYDPARRFSLNTSSYDEAVPWVCAWLGGTLGGTLFDLKWLYHSVAKQIWNVDRLLWRLFTPHLSGGLAFATVLLVGSGLLRIFDTATSNSPKVATGIAFLVGYFSDMAVAKLTELARTLFGQSRPDSDNNQGSATSRSSPPLEAAAEPDRKDGGRGSVM
jgi:hypothetical protein